MKSFIHQLYEADYTRFLKRNKNLDSFQIKKINRYFSKDHPRLGSQFGTEYDWQSKKVRNMEYDEFLNIAKEMQGKSKRAKKKAVKLKGLGGLNRGVDYIEIKVKGKEYKAVIPLNWDASKLIASKNIAKCEGQWCISYQKDKRYWSQYIQGKGPVPVMVIGNGSKWTVMIHRGNKKFDVWDLQDNGPNTGQEIIPDFSIRKNLMTSKTAKLYDEVREQFFSLKPGEITEEVEDSYGELVSDMESYIQELINSEEYFESEVDRELKDTIQKYEDDIADAIRLHKTEFNKFTDKYGEWIESMTAAVLHNTEGTGVNKEGDTVWNIKGVDYTRYELQGYINTYNAEVNNRKEKEESPVPDSEEFVLLQNTLDMLRKMKKDEWYGYKIEEYDRGYSEENDPIYEIEWASGWWPSEEEKFSDAYNYSPDVRTPNDRYEEYFSFAEGINSDLDEDARDDLQMSLYEVEHEVYGGDKEELAKSILTEHDFLPPSDIGE